MSEHETTMTKNEEVMKAILAISDCLIRIESEREVIKDVCNKIKKKYDIKPSVLKKAARAYNDGKNVLFEQESEIAHAMELVDQLLKNS